MRLFALLAAALILPGCASITALGHTFEGAADYTIVPLATPKVACAEEPKWNCVAIAETGRFEALKLDPTNTNHLFQEKDNIHVSLKTGTIGWFSEGIEQRFLNQLAGIISDSPLKGEIAIVANVTEGSRSPGSRDANGQLEGRVVFYSEDILAGQRLNEFNLPIFGPTAYEGGPLTIDLWVMELDRAESEPDGRRPLNPRVDVPRDAGTLCPRSGPAFQDRNIVPEEQSGRRYRALHGYARSTLPAVSDRRPNPSSLRHHRQAHQ
jgi:hypothetical protein